MYLKRTLLRQRRISLWLNILCVIQESNLVYNLSRPCGLKDISWIRPGRVSWSWWSDGGSPNDYNKLVPFVDLAATMGWEYSLIDLGWHDMKNGNIKQLINDAKSKGVGIILWNNSGRPHNHVDAWHVGIMDNPLKRKAKWISCRAISSTL